MCVIKLVISYLIKFLFGCFGQIKYLIGSVIANRDNKVIFAVKGNLINQRFELYLGIRLFKKVNKHSPGLQQT